MKVIKNVLGTKSPDIMGLGKNLIFEPESNDFAVILGIFSASHETGLSERLNSKNPIYL